MGHADLSVGAKIFSYSNLDLCVSVSFHYHVSRDVPYCQDDTIRISENRNTPSKYFVSVQKYKIDL